MSAVGGILYFEPRECERTLLQAIDRRLAHLGPDGGRVVTHGSIGFVHRAFHTTPEARFEHQPYEIDRGVTVCVDGRIDNRGDLASALRVAERATPDVALIAAAYQHWGRECFQRLHGDFAIAIWDARERTLLLARDGFGIRPLYYHADRDRIVWASAPEALLDLPGVSDDLDETYIGDYFTLVPVAAHSAFKWITPVLPGRVMIVRDGSITTQTHWDYYNLPASDANDDPATDGETIEQFRSLLGDAVRVRMRADRPVVAELSGGLDSSSLVGIADMVARDSGGAIPRIGTMSRIYDKGNAGEDGYFIRLIEEHRKQTGLHVTEQDDPLLGPWPDPGFLSFPRRFICTGGARRRGEVLQAAGARVLLSGFIGDELLGQHPGPRDAGRLMRRGRWLRAFNLCREFSLERKRPALMLLRSYGVRPNLPLSMRPEKHYALPAWIEPGFAERHGLKHRLAERLFGNKPEHLAISAFTAPDLLLVRDMIATEGTSHPIRAHCVEMRYPYAHRPLMEFVMSRPRGQIYGRFPRRWLQRAGLTGLMPEEVRTRTAKGCVDESIAKAIDRQWDRLVEAVRDSEACARGYVAKATLMSELTRYRHGQVIGFGDVLKVYALEMWLKGLANRSRAIGEPEPERARAVTATPQPVSHAVCH